MGKAKKRLVVALAAVFATSLLAPSLASAKVREGDRAAEFVSVKDARGKRMKLKQHRKKIVVLTFGASWCKPCKKELPAWDKLAKQYKNKGVVFIAVNIDQDAAKGKAFVKKAGVKNMRVGYEASGTTVESFDPPSMPSTFVIDERGIVRWVHAGYRKGDAKKLAKKLDKLLAK